MNVNGEIANADGLIDQKDAIFKSLRLWSDLNGDGLVDANELFTLEQKQVAYIDLKYDPNHREVDQYGNVIRTKSVVATNNLELHVIFDLWFH